MADELKNPGEQKPNRPETPKGIEDVLKELPKVSVSNPIPPKPNPQNPPSPPKPSTPSLPPMPQPTGILGARNIPEKPLTPIPTQPSQKPTSSPPSPDKFQSLVRTMESDLEAAKKGLKPESKPFEIKPPPKPLISQPPFIPPAGPAKPTLKPLKLGPAEKAKPMEIAKPPVTPRPPTPFAVDFEPKRNLINKKTLLFALAAMVVFAGIWFFMTRQEEEIILFTPTASPTPEPEPLAVLDLFISQNRISIPSTQDFKTGFENQIKTIAVSAGNFTALEIIDENGSQYSLSRIMDGLSIKPPAGLTESLDGEDWTLVVYGQTEIFGQSGFPVIDPPLIQEKRIGFVAKADNPTGLRSALNAWEITMTDDLKSLFGVDPKKTTSGTFLENFYAGETVRYRNFPYADKTIDYSIVSLPDFNADYFVLTSSRESAYSAIDLLQNQ